MKEIKAVKELLKWLKKQKTYKMLLIVPMLAVIAQGCTSGQGINDNFCLWAGPIKLTSDEIDSLSYESVKQILYFNENYESNCKQ